MITSGYQKAQLPSMWKKVVGLEMDYKIGIPCVVQWCMLWFSAPTKFNGVIQKSDLKIRKHHEVVNMAIVDAISRPFGEGAHTEIVHVGVCG